MSLNIKNPETTRLIEELAAMTGETMTGAVTEAVRARLERIRDGQTRSLTEQLLAIGRDTAARLPEPTSGVSHAELLYGDDGLPR